MNKRIDQLDSIRGIASFFVVLHHVYLVAAISMLPIIFKYSPLKIIINGHASVILFFVLSGFVLFIPFLKGSKISYRSFLIKRILRIYIPYLISTLLALLMFSLLSKSGIEDLSDWFNLTWTTPMKPKLIIEHLFLVINPDTYAFNGVIWSLVHEMRISLFFPLIAWCVMRYHWKNNLLVCLILSLFSGFKEMFALSYGWTTIIDTLHYTSMFIIGAILAKNMEKLTHYYASLRTKYKWTLLLIAFISYTYSISINTITKKIGFPFGEFISDYVITWGACVFIICSLGSVKLSKILLQKPIILLGKVSYSLYLFHLIILFSFVYLFYGMISLGFIYALTIAASLLTAIIAYYLIEDPTIRLGRIITRKQPKLSLQQLDIRPDALGSADAMPNTSSHKRKIVY